MADIGNILKSLNKFPSAFKLLNVKSILKKTIKLMYQFTNLSPYYHFFWKLIENVAQEQTSKFLNDGEIFYKYQSSFINYRTDLFLSILNDKILKGSVNGIYTVMILIGLHRTFDTINHIILLYKLLPIGFSKNTISWFGSYLAHRHLLVLPVNQIWQRI